MSFPISINDNNEMIMKSNKYIIVKWYSTMFKEIHLKVKIV